VLSLPASLTLSPWVLPLSGAFFYSDHRRRQMDRSLSTGNMQMLFLRGIEHVQCTAPIEPVLRTKTEALATIEEFKQLAAAFGNDKSEYDKRRRQTQQDDHLSQFSIRGARIPKVNAGNLPQLASYGFTTAFDPKRRDVQQVHGIGPVKASNIAAWIRRVEAKFQFRSAYTPEDQQEHSESPERDCHQATGP
jgi:DNA-binding helix-hairpin-helix protein with protein kinase domain